MGTDEQDEAGIGMIRRGPINPTPDMVAEPPGGGADVRVAIMPIDTPCSQHTLHVAVMSRSPHMVHHLIAAIFHDSGANFRRKGIKHFIPTRALPFALTALASTLEWIENAFGIVDLIDGGWPLRAVAPSTTRMIGIALKAFH